ncbi:protein kinase [Micromonospora sp. PLK6-60]|uniref:serine/threonine-protein kinase n=1 Tax=Micromonospora sp. PLK6-60 TaxID=2873383 RepID=UPI001CA6F78F|nr:serine/threonine-protein kinase [Micromonospora sp. PLK6-60]MBY8872473.1 protein kinase [Micromonospora sp. PLK6-60]
MQQVVIAGRYRLLELVGRGGMGRVWRARDEVLHREVAVKEIVPPSWLAEADRDELRLRTLREARTAARLNHANVVRVYDVVKVNDHPWIIMEYVPSRSLQTVLDTSGPVDPVRAADIGLSLLAALRAAHDAGVLHRDVKPQNVLIAHDGRVMLTDFGLATFDGGDGLTTRPGMVLGSPQFVAPERARDGVSTVEADLWSLGATLHAAVEGRSPYARSTAMATLAALASSPPDPAPNAGPLRPVLQGLLRRDPRKRTRHDETARGLETVTRPVPTTEPPTVPQMPVARPATGLVTPPPAWPGPGRAGADAEAAEAAPTSPAVAPTSPAPAAPPARPAEPSVPPLFHPLGGTGTGRRGGPARPAGGADDPRAAAKAGSATGPGWPETPPAGAGPQPATPPPSSTGPGWPTGPLDPAAAGVAGGPGPGHRRAGDPGAGPRRAGEPGYERAAAGAPGHRPAGGPLRRLADERWALLVMALVVAVVAGVGTALAVTRDHEGRSPSRGGSAAPSGQPEPPGAGQDRAGPPDGRIPPPFPCLRPDPVGVPVGRGPATMDDGFRPPAGWTWQNGTGYRIAVPVGWLRSQQGAVVCFRDPDSLRTLSVEPLTAEAVDPLAHLGAEERRTLDERALPGYDKVRLGADGGDTVWECRWDAPFGSRQRALRLLPGGDLRGWTIGWSTTDADWTVAAAQLGVVRESFRSAGSTQVTPT